ncbi:MAG: DUF255 domain-containing protein [Planctomycetota bacterium]|nr:DUF255 domain-containing protein [Planctomycetota bacterium]
MVSPLFIGRFMPKVLIATLALTFQILASQATLAIEREINWTEEYEAAIQRAATTNSIVLLHFYGDYCPPCKLLDKKTFHDPALVSTMNEHLVAVKVNADRRRDLAQKYQVTRWPTDIYLFPNGDEIYRGVSNADPSVYCKTIERVALRHRDWTVERNAMAKATERRQDKALAAHTPQIHSEKPVYAGSAGHQVRTQAAAWSQQSETQKPVGSSGVIPRASLPNSRIIENPYITQQPIIVPPAPEPQPPVNQVPVSQVPERQLPEKPISVQPVSSQRSSAAQSPAPTAEQPQPTRTPQREITPQEMDASATQRVYAETVGLGGFCPVTLIESLGKANAIGNGWVEGRKSCAVRHRGRVYHCASERARQILLSDPDRYTPCLSGFDIVHLCKEGTLHDGKCEFGCIQKGTNRVFLFETKENYDEFTKNSTFYSRLLDDNGPEHVANEINGTQNR